MPLTDAYPTSTAVAIPANWQRTPASSMWLFREPSAASTYRNAFTAWIIITCRTKCFSRRS